MNNCVKSLGLMVLALTLVACGGSAAPAPASSSPARAASSSPAASGSTAASPSSAAASTAPAGSASAAASTAGPVTDIRLGLIPSTATAPFFVPVDDGSYAAQGLKVTITPVTDTAQAMINIASGNLDMGSVTLGAAALNAFARGTDLKIIASGGVDPPGNGDFAPLIVRSDLMDSGQVKTVADLKGRKVALNGKGVILEYSLYKALAVGGLKPSDVDVVTMPWPDMVVAMANKNLDAGLIGNPLAAQAVAKGVGKILADGYEPNNQNATAMVNAKFLAQHRDAVVKFLEVYLQAIAKESDGKLKKDPQTLAIIQKETKVTPDVIRLAPDPYWPKDGRVNVKSIEDQQTYFMSIKELNYSQPLDINKLIDYGPLDEALKNLGK